MSDTEEPALLAAHNLSLEGLRHASELGGIPAPSIAIIRTDVPFDKYGDVTLVMKPGSASLGSRGFPVYDADVYSPRQPPGLYRVDRDEVDKLNDRFAAASKKLGERGNSLTETDLANRGPAAIERDLAAKVTFLEERGVTFEPPKRRPEGVDEHLAKYVGYEGSRAELAADPDFLRDASASRMERLETRASVLSSYRNRLEADIQEEFDLSGADPVLKTGGVLNAADAVKRAGAEKVDGAKARVEADALIEPREADFKSWCAEAFSGTERGRYFKNAHGRERPYELHALTRDMTRNVKDSEGLYYGAGNVRAALSEKLTGEAAVETAAERIRPEGEVAAASERRSADVDALADRAFPEARWDRKGELLAEMAGAAGTDPARMEAWHQERFGSPLPEGVSEEARRTFLDLKNAPTGYLEAKPQRAVHLSEFRAAIVPRDQVVEAKRALAGQRVAIIPYDGPEDRVRAVREVAQKCAFGRVRGGIEKEGERADEPSSPELEREEGDAPMTLIHRSPDPDLEISGNRESRNIIEDQSLPPLSFVEKRVDFEATELETMEADDLEEILDVSYAPDEKRSSHIYGFECDESEITHVAALHLDDRAAKDIRETLGLDDEDRFDVDAHNKPYLLIEYPLLIDNPNGERCIPMDPEEVLNGEHDRLVNEIGGEESWRIQEIRAETAARAGYIGVRDRDEQGYVIMVAPHEIEEDLNDRLFYVAQDPRHRENRTPEMEVADSWGEEMRLQIDERLEREKNVYHAEIGREAGSDLVAGRKIKLMDVTQEDADLYDAFVAENAVPFEMSKEQRDRIAKDVGLEVVDPDELMRRDYLIERSEELRYEMTPDLPEGYQLRVEVPGPEDRPDHPVGVLRGPDDFEKRYPDVSKEDEPRIETAALTHQDRVRHREADRAEIGDRGRTDGPSRETDERGVAR